MKTHSITLCALLFLSLITIPSAHADEQRTGISVTGECLKKITRDRGAITVSTSTLAPTAKESSKRAIEAHEKFKSAIQALKFPELLVATAGYSVNQECHYSKLSSEPECKGYRTTISTRFETSTFANLEEIIGVASTHGAQNVSPLEAFVSPTLLNAEREGCLEIATKNAFSKAEKIATGAGVRLGKLTSVSEGAGDEHQLWARPGQFGMAAASKDMSIQGPSIDVQPFDLAVVVTSVYGIQ